MTLPIADLISSTVPNANSATNSSFIYKLFTASNMNTASRPNAESSAITEAGSMPTLDTISDPANNQNQSENNTTSIVLKTYSITNSPETPGTGGFPVVTGQTGENPLDKYAREAFDIANQIENAPKVKKDTMKTTEEATEIWDDEDLDNIRNDLTGDYILMAALVVIMIEDPDSRQMFSTIQGPLPGNIIVNFSAAFNLPNKIGTYKARVFVWTDWATMESLVEPQEREFIVQV